MQTAAADFAGPLEARLFRTVEDWCAGIGLGLRAFGAAATGDAELMPSIARGRSPTLATVDAMLARMEMAPAGPAFGAEVAAFLAVTGVKRSVLGREAANNPSWVAHLGQGTSPTLRTVGKVLAWMTAQASPAEARAIRRRAGRLPEILSASPLRPSHRSAETAGVPSPAGIDRLQTDGNGPFFVDTREAAALLGLAPSTLERYRSTGNGPVYHQFAKRTVRYRLRDLAEWQAARTPPRRSLRQDLPRPVRCAPDGRPPDSERKTR